MVLENLQITPLMEWLLGSGWGEGLLWKPTGVALLLTVLLGGGIFLLLALRRSSAAPGPTVSMWTGSLFGAMSLLVLTAVAFCSTPLTRDLLTQYVASPLFNALVPLLGSDWSSGALYTWLSVAIGLTGVVYACCWLASVLAAGPLAGTQRCGRAVIEIASDLARISSRRVFALAWLAVRDSIRRRVVVVFVVFVVLILAAALFIKKDSLHPGQLYIQVVLNFTVYLTMLFALVLSALSLPADIRDRTLHTVVTKPVRKIEIVLGRVLGFVFVGTVLLVGIGVISYGFTVRGLSHTHQLKADAVQYVKTLPGDQGTLWRGATSPAHEHEHEVTIIQRPGQPPEATVETQKDHTHDLYVSGSGDKAVYWLGPPKGQLQARVPIYAKRLSFLDKTGAPTDKGINVGDEWTYRSFIEGATQAAAKWTFEGLGEDLFPESKFPTGIPVEMTLEVFRTHKGNQEQGVAGTISLRNPAEQGKPVYLRNFLAKKFATDVQMIPRTFVTAGPNGEAETIHLFPYFELTKASLAALHAAQQVPADVLPKLEPLRKKAFETERAFVAELATILNGDELRTCEKPILSAAKQPGLVSDDGRLEIIVQCLERQQYYGMAQADLYIRAADNSFAWNFCKGYLGVWLQMALVVSLGVMFSTFLSGPVALLATIFAIIAGLFSGYITELAGGKMVGGGPFESFERIITQDNMISDLEPGLKTNAIKAMDEATALMMRYFSAVVPNVSDNDYVDRVAFGFNVGQDLVARCLFCEVAYLLPVILLGYIALKQREVAL
jgi:ABC-type transport system involved in multi-copper enzyme maturation permease subunit